MFAVDRPVDFSSRDTFTTVQPPPVGTQRCRTIHRWFAALGSHHDTLASFHWLKAPERVQFKLATIVYRSLNGTAL